ncbi:MAG: IS256 family transposase [Comamonadaceae bacterium]
MNKDTVVRFRKKDEVVDPLVELLRNGAHELISRAVEEELQVFLEQQAGRCAANGRLAVVRNGYQPERALLTGMGPVRVQVPKVRDRSGEGAVFRSSLVPPYVRRARSVEAALPWLYLKGISTGDMSEALQALVGKEAVGLSAAVVSRLKMRWGQEYDLWRRQPLGKDRWVYLWADGIYSNLRADDNRLCLLVVIGVNERGQKRFLAIEDGVRESTESWRAVLRDMKARGVKLPPKLAVGDGALGFWAALEEQFPETHHQRCWVHKTANVLNYLPKSVQSKAKASLYEIWMAETRANAQTAFDRFIATYQTKYPKATECLAKDRQALLAFYDFPAEHWVHIRTSNPIESTFATVRHRTERTKGCVSRASLLGLTFKLAMSAENNWRRLRGFERLGELIAGVKFVDGISNNKIKRTQVQPQQAAA